MKTDVIFLGAGASVSAGFPTNEGLTQYIVEELPRRERAIFTPSNSSTQNDLKNHWKDMAQVLREAHSLSVDEFCMIAQPTHGDGLELKKMLSLALFDKTANLKRWNDYDKLVYSLFIQGTADLDDRFTVVNFNYDGLFGKMLVDAVRQRRLRANKGSLDHDRLAAVAGGWYGYGGPNLEAPVREHSTFDPAGFCHHMLHGAFTVVTNPVGQTFSREGVIYSDGDHQSIERWFLTHYDWEPMIHFPWERSSRLPLQQKQFEHAARSVESAKRIHFIGLSGHPLLRHSLADIFSRVHPAMFQAKQWYIATADENQERVFLRLMDCFLPEDLRGNEHVKQQMLKPNYAKFFPSFEAWLSAAPHAS